MPNTCSGYSDGSDPSSRWGSNIKCGLCFRLLSEVSFDQSKCAGMSGSYCGAAPDDNFLGAVTKYWDDWKLNRHSHIMSKLRTLEAIFKVQFPGPTWHLNFLRLDSVNAEYKTSAGELTKEINWFERAKDIFSKKHRFQVVTDPVPNFDLFSELKDGQGYEIGLIYAYLRNARSSNSGEYLVDSDGLGMPDVSEKEPELLNKRSNGKCLDSIVQKYGSCLTEGCMPLVDFDGDGLNQCEEKTLGTDDFEVDTDGDGIADGAEILYAMNPTVNDQRLFYNSDGLSNFEHFVRGYSPTSNLSKISSSRMLDISSVLVDYQVQKNTRGLETRTPGYKIAIRNIPLLTTKDAPGIHGSGINQVVVVARVDSLSNPDEHQWLSKVYDLGNGEPSIPVLLTDLLKMNLGAP